MAADVFLSTPSARRATSSFSTSQIPDRISIHALREEGDSCPVCGGKMGLLFLSTPSARRATCRRWAASSGRCDFYPRPPRGGRPFRAGRRRAPSGISIHALREEGDPRTAEKARPHQISIHALREEGDILLFRQCTRPFEFLSTPSARRATRRNGRPVRPGTYFYPRPPRGGRRITKAKNTSKKRFLSTPSARRATVCRLFRSAERSYFYPRPPRGGRPAARTHSSGG